MYIFRCTNRLHTRTYSYTHMHGRVTKNTGPYIYGGSGGSGGGGFGGGGFGGGGGGGSGRGSGSKISGTRYIPKSVCVRSLFFSQHRRRAVNPQL